MWHLQKVFQMSVIETYSGRIISLLDPKPEDIIIEDIAVGLSQLCRFNGHCSRFYSVAEHSCYVALVVNIQAGSVEDEFAALMHDAAESYVGDVTRPVKRLLGPEYGEIEERFERAIAERFGIDWTPSRKLTVKNADNILCKTEGRDLMPSKGEGWQIPAEPLEQLQISRSQMVPPGRAMDAFMSAFRYLSSRR